MATFTAKDATGATVALEKPLAPGAAAAASSRPVTLSTEDVAKLGSLTETAPASDTASSGLNGRLQRIAQRLTSLITLLTDQHTGEYETVAASQTAQVLGATGATGDYLKALVIIPATTTPGLVTILDNAISIPVFVGGTVDVRPIRVELGLKSVSGAWKVTTGASVSVLAIGNFT